MNPPSEERVMRAREVLARHCKVPGPDLDFVLNGERDNCVAAMIAFADEGSGIGELREAIEDLDLLTDALLDGKTLSVEECRRAKAAVLALKAPDIDRSGLAQEVE